MYKPQTNPSIDHSAMAVWQWEYLTAFFEVSTDELASVMWKGDMLTCTWLSLSNPVKANDLLLVEVSTGTNTFTTHVGWLLSVDHEALTLTYAHARLKDERENCIIPVIQINRLFRVDTISREIAQ